MHHLQLGLCSHEPQKLKQRTDLMLQALGDSTELDPLSVRQHSGVSNPTQNPHLHLQEDLGRVQELQGIITKTHDTL